MKRAELVAEARRTIRAGSKSFGMASRLFDRVTRERAWLLYTWCRHCDDECDGQALGYASSGKGSIVAAYEKTSRVLAGAPVEGLAFEALRRVVEESKIPHRYILDHLEGFVLDERGWRPEDVTELLGYCYYVAGAVGCMMAIVMGVDPDDEETLQRAADLGIAFQLSNIARDVRDDHGAGRCYLPADWLSEHGLEGSSLFEPGRRDRLVALVQRLVGLAARYEESAREGIGKLPFRSRWAVIAAADIYGGIGRRVVSLGPAAWDGRVVVPRRTKLFTLFSAFGRALAA